MDNTIQPEMTTDSSGTKRWMLNGERHRVDGPAVMLTSGYNHWWLNGGRHRVDGPAVEWHGGHSSWYLHGITLTFEEWLDQNQTLTDEEKVMMKLQYG